MPAAPSFALIAVPSATQCLFVLAPLAAVLALYGMAQSLDRIIHRLFPTLAWERQLGWLNLRAERRANAFLRGLGHLLHAVLAVALLGLAWGAIGFRLLPHWDDPDVMGAIDTHLPVFFGCLGLCLLYLGGALLPRLRREYEHRELEDFRAAWSADEEEEHAHARLKSGAKSPVLPRSGRERIR